MDASNSSLNAANDSPDQLIEPPQGVSLAQANDIEETSPDNVTSHDETTIESPQYYQRRRLKSIPNNPAFSENDFGDRNGKRCYVDPFEPFPQATYYLNTSLKRPKYEAQKTKRSSDANLLRNRLNISNLLHSKKHAKNSNNNNKGLINQEMEMELNSDSENDNDNNNNDKYKRKQNRNAAASVAAAVNASDAGGVEFDINGEES